MLFSVRDGREYFLKITNCSPSGKKKPTHFVLVKRYLFWLCYLRSHMVSEGKILKPANKRVKNFPGNSVKSKL